MSELNESNYNAGSWQSRLERSSGNSLTKSFLPALRTSDDCPSEHTPDAITIDGYRYERFPVRDGSGRKLGDVYLKLGDTDNAPLQVMLDLATQDI